MNESESPIVDVQAIPTTALITVPQPSVQLEVSRPPDIVLEEAHKAAAALKKVLDSKEKKVIFNDEVYLESEDWSTVARFYGVTAKIVPGSVRITDFGPVRGFTATAIAIRMADGQELGSAESFCLSDERNWADKPLFQLASMAQTRAQSKVLRHLFSWVVVLAGYRPTPADELTGEEFKKQQAVKMPTRTLAGPGPVGFEPERHGNGEDAIRALTAVEVYHVTERTGEKNGKPWKLYKIELGTGSVLDTFDTNLGESAKDLANSKKAANLTYREKKSGKFTNYELLTIEEVSEDMEMFPG